jgi:hypothetical protein
MSCTVQYSMLHVVWKSTARHGTGELYGHVVQQDINFCVLADRKAIDQMIVCTSQSAALCGALRQHVCFCIRCAFSVHPMCALCEIVPLTVRWNCALMLLHTHCALRLWTCLVEVNSIQLTSPVQ